MLWMEQPGTLALREYLIRKRQWLFQSRANVFYPGDAYKTQEAIISINARLEEVIAFLQLIDNHEVFGNEVNQETDEDGESKRHQAGGVPGSGTA